MPLEYDKIGEFSEGLCAVYKDYEGLGYVNITGEEVIPCRYGYDLAGRFIDSGYAFYEGLAKVCGYYNDGDGHFFFIKSDGTQVGDKYAYAGSYSEGYAAVQPLVDSPVMKGMKFGTGTYAYIDTTGELVIPSDFIYENSYPNSIHYASHFENSLAIVNLLSETGNTTADDYLIDKTGKIFKEFRVGSDYFDSSWRDGVKRIRCDVGEGFNFGFIDENARLIASGFVDTGIVGEGLIAVQKQKESKWGYISAETGETAIPYIYDYAGEFSDGIAFARIGDAPDSSLLQILGMQYYPYCLIDNKGTQLSEHSYIGVIFDANNRLSLSQNPATPFTDNKTIAAIANGDGTYSLVELAIVRK